MDATNEGGTTSLMFACMNGHVDVARLLLEKGAAMDSQRSDCHTAYSLAEFRLGGDAEVVTQLRALFALYEESDERERSKSGSSSDSAIGD